MILAALAGQGCAARTPRLAYAPDELRAELARRIPVHEVVVPYEIGEEHARRARALVADVQSDAEKVEVLVKALLGKQGFGLRYQVGVPGTAEEAFAHGGGDCLALASAFVGLARAAGLEASYMDASFWMQETEYLSDQTTVKVGHVTAYVRTTGERYGLDFARLGRVYRYRPIDDLEAVAHFHNNLGYLLVERGLEAAGAGGWAAAEHQFELSVRVKPDFARGWNNLGVARARLGRRAEAREAYRRAIASDRTFASPRLNLGVLLLEAGEVEGAWEQLEAAVRLDPSAATAHYELGVARLRRGDRRGAMRSLERAISLRRGWPAAQALLDQIAAGRDPPRPARDQG